PPPGSRFSAGLHRLQIDTIRSGCGDVDRARSQGQGSPRMGHGTLVLVHERPEDCLRRLIAEGHPVEQAREIASYLAQSIDMEPEFHTLDQACAERHIRFEAATLDA